MKCTAVIILEYNNADDTINCINSVERFNTSAVKYIVIDNGSPDRGVVERLTGYLKEKFGDVTVCGDGETTAFPLGKATFIASGCNNGYASGNNKGLKLAYGDDEVSHVMVLNSDILFVEDIIPGLLDDVDSLADAAFVSPLLYKKGLVEPDYNCARRAITLRQLLGLCACLQIDFFGITRRQRISLEGRNGCVPIQLPSGSCMLCRKELFECIGSFDPNTFLYYEENILWEKVRPLGLVNYVDTRLRCVHLGATSTRQQPSLMIARAGSRSINYFARNYLHAGFVTRWLLRLFTTLNELKIKTIIALRGKKRR